MARVPSDECPYPILERFIRFREFIREGMEGGDERGRGGRIEGNNKDDNADDEEDNDVREEGGEWRIMGRSLFSTNKVPSTSSPSRRLRLSAP